MYASEIYSYIVSFLLGIRCKGDYFQEKEKEELPPYQRTSTGLSKKLHVSLLMFVWCLLSLTCQLIFMQELTMLRITDIQGIEKPEKVATTNPENVAVAV